LISETKTLKLETECPGLKDQRRLTLSTVSTNELLQQEEFDKKEDCVDHVTVDDIDVYDVIDIDNECWEGDILSFCEDEDEDDDMSFVKLERRNTDGYNGSGLVPFRETEITHVEQPRLVAKHPGSSDALEPGCLMKKSGQDIKLKREAVRKCSGVILRSKTITKSCHSENVFKLRAGSQQLRTVLPAGSQQLRSIVPAGSQQLRKVLPAGSQQLRSALPAASQQLRSVVPAGSQQLRSVVLSASAAYVKCLTNSSSKHVLTVTVPLAPIRLESLRSKNVCSGRLSADSKALNVQPRCGQRVMDKRFSLSTQIPRDNLALASEGLVESEEQF